MSVCVCLCFCSCVRLTIAAVLASFRRCLRSRYTHTIVQANRRAHTFQCNCLLQNRRVRVRAGFRPQLVSECVTAIAADLTDIYYARSHYRLGWLACRLLGLGAIAFQSLHGISSDSDLAVSSECAHCTLLPNYCISINAIPLICAFHKVRAFE